MRESSNIMWSSARSEAVSPWKRRSRSRSRFGVRSARRLRLRFDEAAGVSKLTCPWRTSRGARWPGPSTSANGSTRSSPGRGRPSRSSPARSSLLKARSADRLARGLAAHAAPHRRRAALRRPATALPHRIQAFLKRHARDVMSRDIAEYSASAGVRPRSVTIGDAATRWGSCSSQGRIRMSWRLIFAPPEVRRFVAAHEVAHLRAPRSRPRLQGARSAAVRPRLADAKAALRRIGPRLRRIGRDD